MNFYALLSVLFIISNKWVVNESKVNVLDLLLIVNALSMVISFFTILFSRGSLSFIVPSGNRILFFSRAFEGWVLIVVYIIGNTLIPATVQQALTNTTPFWAALVAYCFISEKTSWIEVVSMILSFGGVILITVTQTQQSPTDNDNVEGEDGARVMTEPMILKDKPALAGLVGCMCIIG